ncbi:MAG: hypothetical protein MJ189_03620 [Coriobacteriales bacterium]|nr:hypothetical protein [Coriobacteriales bacterium]
MEIFEYGHNEIEHLCSKDKRFVQLVEYFNERKIKPKRFIESDPFTMLIHAINDQLISLSAAHSIWHRIQKKYGLKDQKSGDIFINPKKLALANIEDLHACGTTLKKAEYMIGLAQKVASGELDFASLREKVDEEIIDELCAIRGIGKWTAEMFLIHALARPNVISYGDAAIRRGMCMLYKLNAEDLTKEKFERYAKRYNPYATTASIYFWRLSIEKEITI